MEPIHYPGLGIHTHPHGHRSWRERSIFLILFIPNGVIFYCYICTQHLCTNVRTHQPSRCDLIAMPHSILNTTLRHLRAWAPHSDDLLQHTRHRSASTLLFSLVSSTTLDVSHHRTPYIQHQPTNPNFKQTPLPPETNQLTGAPVTPHPLVPGPPLL
jgi:hypothetical protein